MSNTNFRTADLPLLPALYLAVLTFGAAVHANPALLRPVLGFAHSLATAVIS